MIAALATRVLWGDFAVEAGLLAALGRIGWVAALVMLLALDRLRRLDPRLEETAVDLGASPELVLRRLLAPHLASTIAVAALLAVLATLADVPTLAAALDPGLRDAHPADHAAIFAVAALVATGLTLHLRRRIDARFAPARDRT